jgi:hypothetical protein
MTGTNALEERVDLRGVSAREDLHTAIGQVFHGAGDLVFAGKVFDGVAKTDALHTAFVVDFDGFHWGGKREAGREAGTFMRAPDLRRG